jgi:hypothetical protein
VTYENNRSFIISNKKIFFFCVGISILSRLIPHPPGMTPLTNLCLFSGYKLPRNLAFLSITLTLIITDIGLSLLKGYPMFGSWQLFTYTGALAMALFGSKLPKKNPLRLNLLIYVLGSSLGFWLWTNLGVWLLGSLYPLTLQGFFSCYIAALPFLQTSLIGDSIWYLAIFGFLNFIYTKFLQAKVAEWQTRWI